MLQEMSDLQSKKKGKRKIEDEDEDTEEALGVRHNLKKKKGKKKFVR